MVKPPALLFPRLFFHHDGHEDHEEPLLHNVHETFVLLPVRILFFEKFFMRHSPEIVVQCLLAETSSGSDLTASWGSPVASRLGKRSVLCAFATLREVFFWLRLCCSESFVDRRL